MENTRQCPSTEAQRWRHCRSRRSTRPPPGLQEAFRFFSTFCNRAGTREMMQSSSTTAWTLTLLPWKPVSHVRLGLFQADRVSEREHTSSPSLGSLEGVNHLIWTWL